MILNFLDLIPIDDSYYVRYNMTPKERKKYDKAQRKAEKKAAKARKKAEKARKKAEKKKAKQQSAQTIAPFKSFNNDNAVNLQAQANVTTSSRDMSSAGMKYEASASSMLLSSILIVGAALFLCISGAIAYRKNAENK